MRHISDAQLLLIGNPHSICGQAPRTETPLGWDADTVGCHQTIIHPHLMAEYTMIQR